MKSIFLALMALTLLFQCNNLMAAGKSSLIGCPPGDSACVDRYLKQKGEQEAQQRTIKEQQIKEQPPVEHADTSENSQRNVMDDVPLEGE